MKLRQIFSPGAIVPELTSTDRDGAMLELLRALAADASLPESALPQLQAALLDREAGGSTGIGKGVAVPHAKLPSVPRMVGAIGRAPRGLDFHSLDRQPVYTIILLLSPVAQPQNHLMAMNVIFTNLMRDNFRKQLRNATTVEQVLDLLSEADNNV